jgi:hypothetical protein
LSAVWMTGMIEFHGHVPAYADTVSERPAANPLARIQAHKSPRVSTLLHTTLTLDDGLSRKLVTLLDGSRSQDELVSALLDAIPAERRPERAMLATHVGKVLDRFAAAGLLVN